MYLNVMYGCSPDNSQSDKLISEFLVAIEAHTAS